MSRTLKFKLLYFRNKARYGAENRQTDIFLKPLVADEDKNSKGSLVLCFIFYDVTCNPRKSWARGIFADVTGYILFHLHTKASNKIKETR